jgi:hypothetical protein
VHDGSPGRGVRVRAHYRKAKFICNILPFSATSRNDPITAIDSLRRFASILVLLAKFG